MQALLLGLSLGFSLIIAIGPQNMFLIRQAAYQEYALVALVICCLCDTLLIVGSGAGFGFMGHEMPTVKFAMIIIGMVFLLYYSGQSLYSVYEHFASEPTIEINQSQDKSTPGMVVLMALSFSLLNPQAIIDTVVMIGGSAVQFNSDARVLFIVGALLSSYCWFCGLVLAASRFQTSLQKPRVWMSLELVSGLVMLAVAVHLGAQLF